jgi:PEP-CTERM/exosortase A-associated glycosyltransferase
VLDGYSQRSRSLISTQSKLGMYPCVLTGPLHQDDDPAAKDTSLDDVRYLRTLRNSGLAEAAIRQRWPFVREVSVIHLLRKRIQEVLDSDSFDIVHAHSPALCGVAGLQGARSRGVPFVYEIRSFWEDSSVTHNKTTQRSVRYRLARLLETYVVRRADAIVGIARSILDEVKERGVLPGKLFHIPNGVDFARFKPQVRDAALARELHLEGTPTLGYLGTLFPWEGVSWLVRAAAELRNRGVSFKLLIVGDGAETEAVRKAILETSTSDFVQYLGRVPNEQVERYYSVMDVLVYPRCRSRLTELVTPLKPLEAMALGKVVLASAVGGLRELIEPEVTGVLFEPEDMNSFCQQAARLLLQPGFRRIGEQARAKIAAKDWRHIAENYRAVYEAAIRNTGTRASSSG